MNHWLGLVIGNSRLHWAWFEAETLQTTWNTPHLSEKINSVTSLNQNLLERYHNITKTDPPTIYLASVVPLQTALWQNFPHLRQITLNDIPLQNIYPTLGIDRALAIYGAGETYHYPCLVIDAGTALTFTGVDDSKTLIGGAILAGLRSQFNALHQQTAALPQLTVPCNLPPLWALNTSEAISSGIIHTLIAGILYYINDWLKQYPHSSITLTGGDSQIIFQHLKALSPQIATKILVDCNLSFWGMQSLLINK